MFRVLGVLAAAVGMLGLVGGGEALAGCAAWCAAATCAPATCAPATCAPATCQPQVQYVEKTVLCPTYVTEQRTVKTVEYRPEIRQKKVTECQLVCETRMVEKVCTVLVPETRMETVSCVVSTPVWKDVTQEYTVMVPRVEKRQGTRKACKMVPVKETRTVMKQKGHWEERPCPAPKTCAPATCAPATCAPAACAPATAAPQTCKVWVPECVEEQVEVTCMKPQIVEEPYEYCVTVWEPQKRTRTVRVSECKQEVITKEVPRTVMTSKQVTRQCPVTTYRSQPVERVVRYCEMVPYEVEKVVPVCTVKMVPKKVQVPVCCGPCCCR